MVHLVKYVRIGVKVLLLMVAFKLNLNCGLMRHTLIVQLVVLIGCQSTIPVNIMQQVAIMLMMASSYLYLNFTLLLLML